MIKWKVEKPNKDGIWLWRFPCSLRSGKHKFVVGMILVTKNKVYSWNNEYSEDLDSWWKFLKVQTHYVGEYGE